MPKHTCTHWHINSGWLINANEKIIPPADGFRISVLCVSVLYNGSDTVICMAKETELDK